MVQRGDTDRPGDDEICASDQAQAAVPCPCGDIDRAELQKGRRAEIDEIYGVPACVVECTMDDDVVGRFLYAVASISEIEDEVSGDIGGRVEIDRIVAAAALNGDIAACEEAGDVGRVIPDALVDDEILQQVDIGQGEDVITVLEVGFDGMNRCLEADTACGCGRTELDRGATRASDGELVRCGLDDGDVIVFDRASEGEDTPPQ